MEPSSEKNNRFMRVSGDSIRAYRRNFSHIASRSIESTPELSKAEETAQFFEDLKGEWFGNKGWNLVAMPAPNSVPEDTGNFTLLIAPYSEVLSFKNAGAPAPNRGGKNTQFVGALEYHQRVSDKETNELMHVENGMFLDLSDIRNQHGEQEEVPKFNVARSGSIPHGDSIMILGKLIEPVSGRPPIDPIDSRPPEEDLQNAPLGYLVSYQGFKGELDITNPNATLLKHLRDQEAAGFEVISTQTLVLDSENDGGITNVPFIVKHANVTRMQAVFWLEKVRNKTTGQVFDQLQYTQVIDLVFHHQFLADGSPDPDKLITWPHVTINTMVKQ